MPADIPQPRRPSRLRLYAPFIALAVLAIGWSVAWFLIRGRVVSGLDEWIAAEAGAGRRWTCVDRTVGGYPFRIEIGCASLKLERRELAAELGRLHVVAQVYNPSHIIAEAAGPLRVTSGAGTITSTWRLLQASVVTSPGAERAAIVADEPTVRVERAGSAPFDAAARRSEVHVRPDPAERTTADISLSSTGAAIAGLDALVGGTEPADLDLALAVTRAYDLPTRPIWTELDRWRSAGGVANLQRLSVRKGSRRIEATGTAGVDEGRRPTGQLQVSATKLDGVLGRLVGGGLAGGVLGALLGGGSARTAPAEPGLRPLPPVRLENGRVYLGPLPIPGVTVPPLY